MNHIGCAAHRLQSFAGIVFTGEEVQNALANERKTTARYKTRQAAERFRKRCVAACVKPRSLIQDLPTRWSLTADSNTRFLKMK